MAEQQRRQRQHQQVGPAGMPVPVMAVDRHSSLSGRRAHGTEPSEWPGLTGSGSSGRWPCMTPWHDWSPQGVRTALRPPPFYLDLEPQEPRQHAVERLKQTAGCQEGAAVSVAQRGCLLPALTATALTTTSSSVLAATGAGGREPERSPPPVAHRH